MTKKVNPQLFRIKNYNFINSQNTNFFDFASIFMDIFSCKNALYLDGAISEMYLKDHENSIIGGGRFGSLIYVKRKIKTK